MDESTCKRIILVFFLYWEKTFIYLPLSGTFVVIRQQEQ